MDDDGDDELENNGGQAAQPPPRKAWLGRPQHDPENQPWVEKYRPKSLAHVAAHKEIIDTIGRLTSENKLPHLLLYGPPGTGKTSTILAVARQMYGEKYKNMTLELNASDDRGIEVVRQEIQDFASTKLIFSSGGIKLIVLDECDAMTKDAQFALRRVIEKYARSTRFCLICNYVGKVIPALQSRCTKFRFAPLPRDCVLARLEEIVAAEGVPSTAAGLEAVAKLAGGDMRKSLNILQATTMAAGRLDEAAVYAVTGQPHPGDIAAARDLLLSSPFAAALDGLAAMQADKGFALVDLLRELAKLSFALCPPSAALVRLIDEMAEIEYRLAAGANERLQLAALVAAFTHLRKALVAAAR